MSLNSVIDLYKYHINENADDHEIKGFKIEFSLNEIGSITSEKFSEKFINQKISIETAEKWILENSKLNKR